MKTLKSVINDQFRNNALLITMACFAVCLLITRVAIARSEFYFFLAWNIFLAYVPLGITGYMIDRPHLIEKRHYFYPLFFAWLMFLPNAPYIITDFIHLKRETSIPVWFDVLLLISFSLSGLLFGIKSMKHMFLMLAVRFNYFMTWGLMLVISFLAGFGIYLGRFLRYNSWDILHKPLELIQCIFESLTVCPECKTSWGMTVGFGVFMFLAFIMYPEPE
ncbi:DUF1361 domain-containing protein [Flavobacterium rakeshii]|uniref:DUF1361 domain-containing protein n=1 Tax=Flavobacterium rakeshii TaxID=1038845 RepID=UPI002E7AFE11|nr:DUF1361 domain-containing protein [Flavobacterium rakeshii]MEE1898197.1 DUF1361 domain-containing protein [Flavobacterium rakeshii]